ncbi:acyl-CoA-binding domain protein, partial [Trifolium medium]|nr:acyl-CoA-binding domain protein [Trifolium medium]
HGETLIFDIVKNEWSVTITSPPSSITTNKRASLGAMLRLLPCNLEVTNPNLRNSLSACERFQLGTCAIQGKGLSCCIWGIQKRAIQSGGSVGIGQE